MRWLIFWLITAIVFGLATRNLPTRAEEQRPFDVVESGGFCVAYNNVGRLSIASRATATPGVLLSCK